MISLYVMFRKAGFTARLALSYAKKLVAAERAGITFHWEWDDQCHWSDWEPPEEHLKFCPEARRGMHERGRNHRGRSGLYCEHTYEGVVAKRKGEKIASVYGFQDVEGETWRRAYEAELAGEALDEVASRYAANPPVTYAEIH